MLESSMKTLDIPSIGGDPALLFYATTRPFRVLVHNTGGNLVFIAHAVDNLPDAANVTNAFQLPAGKDATFFLAPGQRLVAAAQGGGGLLSFAASEVIVGVFTEQS